jgi:hypothetical protein
MIDWWSALLRSVLVVQLGARGADGPLTVSAAPLAGPSVTYRLAVEPATGRAGNRRQPGRMLAHLVYRGLGTVRALTWLLVVTPAVIALCYPGRRDAGRQSLFLRRLLRTLLVSLLIYLRA